MDAYDNYDEEKEITNAVMSFYQLYFLHTAKLRPGLIVQADNLQTNLPQLIVAMITSKMFRANHPSRVTILVSTPEGQQSGLIMDLVVMTDNLATVVEATIERVVGSIPMEKLT